jgi:hypothetical protein
MDDQNIPITRPNTIVGGPPINRGGMMPQPMSLAPRPTQNSYPSETIDLPSEGHFYPEGHPLSGGTIELKMMTAREEDILTNQNLIRKGIVLDKLLEALIITPVNMDDLLVGDKNAVFFAARRLAYGDSYGPVKVLCPKCQAEVDKKIDLSQMKIKEFDFSKFVKGQNEFEFIFPYTQKVIKYKLLTHKDEGLIDAELKSLNKMNKNSSSEVTTRLKAMIISIDGNTDKTLIRKFVDNELPSKDSLAFRKHSKENSPDLDMTFDFVCDECSNEERMAVPLTAQFFWPDTGR